MIPTALVEVDVVRRRRDGVPTVALVPAGGAAEGESGAELAAAADALGVQTSVLESLGVSGSAGEVRTIPLPQGQYGWTVGVGDGTRQQWRSAGASIARAARERLANSAGDSGDPEDLGDAHDAEYVQLQLPGSIDGPAVSALALGLALGDYRFRVTHEAAVPRLRKALLLASDSAEIEPLRSAVARAREWSTATALTRDLANAPSNVKNPAWLTDLAAQLAGRVRGLSAVVRDEKWLAEHRFGGVLAVGGGSVSPPRLLEMTYAPEGAERHLVLVGKGITFDTGGISIKPADGMHLMRTDMAGGAAVIAAALSIARLQLPVRITALVPAAENHVSGSSYRPGDVVRHYGGTTTEVANTDAEGRMVLADALAYTADRHDPDLVVDVATLTGAMKVGLGLRTGAVFASDEGLGRQVRAAGERTGEAWWPMPLLDDHVADVQGDLADLKQAAPGPGGITAALFLREFTSGLPWAHLDIAGPARADKPYGEVVPGATGFAARSLIELAADVAGEGPG